MTISRMSGETAVATPETSCPGVSVVIVCFNQAQYLGAAIESVLDQHQTAAEVIVIDDGSSDETCAVASAYPQVRYVHQSNRGLAAARNHGLRVATGTYVTFLDADDRLLPNALQDGLKCFNEHPDSAFVYGGFRNIFSDGSPAPSPTPNPVESDHYRHLLEGNFIGMHGTVLYRRNIIESAGGFREDLRACEDYELYLRIARRHALHGYSAIVAEYRQHDFNMSRDYSFMLNSVLKVLALERTKVRGRAHRNAARTGVRVWKDYYGTLLLEQWQTERSLKGLLKIARLWPSGVIRKVVGGLTRRFRRRRVDFGSLRKLEPFSRCFGFDRGQPIDRYYIESFLSSHAVDIRGHALEIGDDTYSRRFGGGRVTRQEVLHVVPGHPAATIIADLADAPYLASDDFHCIVLTQTLHYIFDVRSAIATVHRILKPGGVVLATVPGISSICRDQQDKQSDCWRFTAASARRLFTAQFGERNVEVRTYGNVLAAVAFLEGLAVEDLKHHELDHHDPDYQVTIAVRAVKTE